MWAIVTKFVYFYSSSSICIDGTITESKRDGNKDDMGLQTSSDFTLVGNVS